jgi:kynurenine formamidase
MRFRIILLLLPMIAGEPANSLELDEYRLVDLSHSYGPDTLYWPTSPSAFQKETLAFGDSGDGYFYSAYSVCTPEHGGTHLDAPIHFSQGGVSTEALPLENLIGPAVVIDISAQSAADRDYRLSADDVSAFEERHGTIAAGSIVLVRTNWSRHWPDALAYLGDDTPGDASQLRFPGIGADAARVLAEDRAVAIMGIDTASIDFGRSMDFIAHRIGAAEGVANLENLTNLAELPPTGAWVMALPMKIEGGSGGPVRVVALVPR